MKTVYVVGGDPSVCAMFKAEGWAAWKDEPLSIPNLICFTGGADVSPYIYGEEPEGARGCNPVRDEFELAVFNEFKGKVPMVGICRGGQLLNVLNGGKLIQHLGRTVSGDVQARRQLRSDMYENHVVRVDHHQGIVPTREADPTLLYLPEMNGLTYACYYPETKCLCFQPHPEWGHEGTKSLFFNLLQQYLNV